MYGHGTFIYQPEETRKKYGSYEKAAKAMKDLGMVHAWVRVHNAKGIWKSNENSALIAALRAEGLTVFGWGWCDGNDIDRNIDNVRNSLATFDLDGYVADVEAEEANVKWTKAWLDRFCREVRDLLGTKPFLLSTYGFLPYHQPDLIKVADPYVDAFAPQVYWFRFPNQEMLGKPGATGTYPLNNAASYVNLCIDVWKHVVTKPIVVTGQGYWGESQGWNQALAEKKLREFAEGFDRFDEIAGLNWWHFAGDRAMSNGMLKTISEARFGDSLPHVSGGATPAAEKPATGTGTSTATKPQEMIVSGDGLRVRSKPGSAEDETVLAILDLGQLVSVVGSGSSNGWVRIAVELADRIVEGEVFAKFLREPAKPKVEALLMQCVSEWIRFDRGRGPENAKPWRQRVGEMWAARGYKDWDGVTKKPWSAAFISWVIERAGYTDFLFAVGHAKYIQQAIHRREIGENGPFWGFRLNEHKPQLGDIVCIDRSNQGIDYDYAEDHDRYDSHCDIIVQLRPDSVRTIGGNTGQSEFGHNGSVAMKTMPLDANGFLTAGGRRFAILRNNFNT